jgi:hypothetical protein
MADIAVVVSAAGPDTEKQEVEKLEGTGFAEQLAELQLELAGE